MRLISHASSSEPLDAAASRPARRPRRPTRNDPPRRREVLRRGARRARHVDAAVQRGDLVDHRRDEVGGGRRRSAGRFATRSPRYRRAPMARDWRDLFLTGDPRRPPRPRRGRRGGSPSSRARLLQAPAREPVQDARGAERRDPGDALRHARRRDVGAPGGGADHGRRRRAHDRRASSASSSRRRPRRSVEGGPALQARLVELLAGIARHRRRHASTCATSRP